MFKPQRKKIQSSRRLDTREPVHQMKVARKARERKVGPPKDTRMKKVRIQRTKMKGQIRKPN